MDIDEFWRAEAQFWTGGAEHRRLWLHPQAVMAFPVPSGVLAGADLAKSLDGAPGWQEVEMTERAAGAPGSDLRVLAYRVQARPADGGAYSAYCTSTYVRLAADEWRIVQHQQTPIASGAGA